MAKGDLESLKAQVEQLIKSAKLTQDQQKAYKQMAADISAGGNSLNQWKVLLRGDNSHYGKWYCWNVDETGVITSGSGWKNTADAINDGWTVCIWDDRRVAPYKDINDMVMGGISAEDVTKIILENAHQGLSAKVKFQEWKKV